MRLWRLIVREGLEDLGQQIKTSTKLTENSLCDKPTTNTSSKTQTITINNNAVLCRQCRLCKRDVAISTYSSKDSPYCPDCEKALSEIITWWNSTARKWYKRQKTEMGSKESIMGDAENVRPLLKY